MCTKFHFLIIAQVLSVFSRFTQYYCLTWITPHLGNAWFFFMCTGVTDFFWWYTCGRAALSNLIKSALQHSMFTLRPTTKTYISIVCHLTFETIYIFSKRVQYWKPSFSPLRNNSIIEQNHCFVCHLCSAAGSGSNKCDWCVSIGLIALPSSPLSGGFLRTKHWELSVNGAKQHPWKWGIDYQALLCCKTSAPLRPKLLV